MCHAFVCKPAGDVYRTRRTFNNKNHIEWHGVLVKLNETSENKEAYSLDANTLVVHWARLTELGKPARIVIERSTEKLDNVLSTRPVPMT